MIRITIVPRFEPKGNTLMVSTAPPTPPSSDATAPGHSPMVTLDSEQILRGSQEVAIAHNGRLYRLRKTRNGKLILT